MNSGKSILLREKADHYGFLTAEAAAVLLGTNPNAASKHLTSLVKKAELERVPYIPPRSIWKPYRKLGSQALPMRAAVLCFCLHGETRYELERWDGPAAICVSGELREAVFIDLKATPDHVGRKLRDYCRERNLEHVTGLTVLVPSAQKGQKVLRAAAKHSLSRPVRCVVIEDLRRLLS